MTTLSDLLSFDRASLGLLLGDALRRSDAWVSPDDLADTVFRGTTLGLPPLVTRLTWSTFQKVVLRDGRALRGYNVRLAQDGLEAPSRPLLTGAGAPLRFGPFAVIDGPSGVVLDYGVHENRWSPTRFVRDPLVKVGEHLYLGVSNVHLGRVVIGTPTYFALAPERPVTDDDRTYP